MPASLVVIGSISQGVIEKNLLDFQFDNLNWVPWKGSEMLRWLTRYWLQHSPSAKWHKQKVLGATNTYSVHQKMLKRPFLTDLSNIWSNLLCSYFTFIQWMLLWCMLVTHRWMNVVLMNDDWWYYVWFYNNVIPICNVNLVLIMVIITLCVNVS